MIVVFPRSQGFLADGGVTPLWGHRQVDILQHAIPVRPVHEAVVEAEDFPAGNVLSLGWGLFIPSLETSCPLFLVLPSRVFLPWSCLQI